MRFALLSLLLALAFFAASGWAFRDGANYQLRDLSAADRMLALDISLIDEKWLAISAGLTCAGGASLLLSVFLYVRGRKARRP